MNKPHTYPKPVRRWFRLALFAASVTGACVSYSTPEDFNRALARAQKGESAAVIRELRERFGGMSETERQETVRVVGQIKDKDAPEFLKEIVRGGQYQPVVRTDALSALTRRDEPGTPEFVRDSIKAHHPLLSEAAGEYLVTKQPENAALALHEAIEGKPRNMSEKVIRFLGSTRYTAAIPDLKAAAKSGHQTQAALEALADMKNPDADQYLFAAAKNKEDPQRNAALRLVLSKRAVANPKEAAALLKDLLQNTETGDREVTLLAIDLAPQTNTDETREGLRRIYRESKTEELRTRALASLAKMERTSPFILTREMQGSLIALQITMARWAPDAPAAARAERPSRGDGTQTPPARVARREPLDEPKSTETRDPIRPRSTTEPGEKTAPSSVETGSRRNRHRSVASRRAPRDRARRTEPRTDEARIPRKANYPRSAEAYRAQFYTFLLESLPEEDARAVYGKISNALRVYGTSNSPSGRFVRRAYTQEYGTSTEAELAKLLQKGVSHPGSVHAVLLGIYREYPNDSLRTFAIAQLFGVPRWQAAVVLGFARR